jgi:hypothetical protein
MALKLQKKAIVDHDDERRKVCKRWFIVGRLGKKTFESSTKIKV